MSTINKNNIFIANHVYINEYNYKTSIFITKQHVNIIITITTCKYNNYYFAKVKYEISNRTRGGVITHSLRFVAAHLTE